MSKRKTGWAFLAFVIVIILIAPKDSVVGHLRWSAAEAIMGN